MATTLALRNTTNNGISVGGSIYYDMVPTFGSAADTAVVDTAASGTEIQWTDETTNDVEVVWVSGRAPAGGFTLTSVDLSIWCHESNMNANCGARARLFERTPGGTETEIGGGPFNDGVEFGTAAAEMLWTANVTDTVIEEDNRLVLKLYITNVGTMAGGHTCTLTFNAASGATGDSFITLAETVTFKSEVVTGTVAQTLPKLGQSASGAEIISGTGAQTLPKLAQAAAGSTTSLASGAAAQTLPRLQQSAAGKETIAGSVAATLPRLTQAASGLERIDGSAAQTIPNIQQALAGSEISSGAVTQTLPRLQQSGTGTAGGPPPPPAESSVHRMLINTGTLMTR